MEKGIRIVESGSREGKFFVVAFVTAFKGVVAGVGRVSGICENEFVTGDRIGGGKSNGELDIGNSDLIGLAMKSPKSSSCEVVLDCKVRLCLAVVNVVFAKSSVSKRENAE